MLFALWNLRGSQLSESGRTFVRLGGQVELVFLDDTVLTRPGQEELPAWSVGRRLAEVLGRGYVMWRATVRAPVRILLGRDAAGQFSWQVQELPPLDVASSVQAPLLVRAPSAAGPSASYSEIPAEPPGRAFDDMNLPEMAFSISLRAIDNERAAEAFLLLAQLGVREPPHQFNRSFYLPTPTGDTQIAIPDSRVLVAPDWHRREEVPAWAGSRSTAAELRRTWPHDFHPLVAVIRFEDDGRPGIWYFDRPPYTFAEPIAQRPSAGWSVPVPEAIVEDWLPTPELSDEDAAVIFAMWTLAHPHLSAGGRLYADIRDAHIEIRIPDRSVLLQPDRAHPEQALSPWQAGRLVSGLISDAMDTFVPENGVQRITVGYDTAGFLALALESIDEAHEYHPLAPPGTYPPPPPPEWQFPGLAVGDLTRHRLIPDRVSNEFAGLVFLLWQLRADTTGFRYYVSTGLGPIEICIPDWRVIVVPDAHLPNQRISAWAGASALAPLIRATWEGLPEAARPVRVTVGYDRSGKPAAIIEDMPIPDGPLPSLTDQAPPWPVSTTAHRQIIRRLRSRPRELLVPLSDPFPGTLNWSGQRPESEADQDT
ncbi:hypothetical protein [Granulicoccus phenolivorans]|uniref:hypothetical protein n=1 Tax=Granulicoccus phenolivorans TaxID=266854 RepID=UPI00047C389C|nr:hypothetical protein [Granulicoccus phenolivorans]